MFIKRLIRSTLKRKSIKDIRQEKLSKQKNQNHHYLALIRWVENEIRPVNYKPIRPIKNDIKNETEYTDKDRIVKYPSLQILNTKIASYGIECTNDMNSANEHRCYAVGMSWYENDNI